MTFDGVHKIVWVRETNAWKLHKRTGRVVTILDDHDSRHEWEQVNNAVSSVQVWEETTAENGDVIYTRITASK